MPLVTGEKLGPYEINARLGAGGMGEVYRAKDVRLGREVAIKILPTEFSTNQNRMDRFEQEARAASALNHPNIITVYDFGAHQQASYIAMEFVEGKSLREVLQPGALPIKKAVGIAAQIADGLAKAHEAGIVHRDLKPENIMLSKDGFAKILDFGLAKSLGPVAAEVSGLQTLAHTTEGTILGTAGYMSPEQASGLPIDFRSDQFSFGSIVYEMLSGKRAFVRNTAVQSLSAIIQDEPEPLQTLNPQTPAPVRWIIDRCLAKDPADRYASTRDLARELQSIRDHFSDLTSSTEALSPETVADHRSRVFQKLLPWILLITTIVLFGSWIAVQQKAPPQAVTRRLEIAIPRGYQLSLNAPLALSPDGNAIVFGLLDQKMQSRLWLRYLDKFEAKPLTGTEGANFPFWSPDSKSIAFFVEGNSTLRRLDLESGTNQVICTINGPGRGGSWSRNGTIIFTPGTNDSIKQVSANGGTPTEATILDPAILDGSHRYPTFLPDGDHFLFTLWSNHLETAARIGGIYLGSLHDKQIRKLSPDSSQAILANDRVLTYRNEGLQAVAFDPNKLELTNVVEEITEHPLFLTGSGCLAATASNAGDIAYALSSGEGTAQLAWVDSAGTQRFLGHDRLGFQNLVIAPDGSRFAAQVVTRNGAEIWVADADRGVMTRMTRGGLDAVGPVWSPDGSSIAYTSEVSGNQSVYIQPADGSKPGEIFYRQADRDSTIRCWSSDGRSMFLESKLKTGTIRGEIWQLDAATKKAVRILSDATANLGSPSLSPDGRWLAYASDESGNNEIYLRPYPKLDRKWQISQSGTLTQSSYFAMSATTYLPHWRKDSKEIMFVALDGSIKAVSIETQGENLIPVLPRFVLKPNFPFIAITPNPDHDKFLAAVMPGDATSEPIRLVLRSHR